MGGPARFFVHHPLLYGFSLAGAGGTALYALGVAARRGPGRRRLLHGMLGIQCAAEFVGIAVGTERARRELGRR